MPGSSIDDRFWRKVDTRGDCWEWTASRTPAGYGKFAIGGNMLATAHRWAYECLVGPIPDGLVLDHLCRNRRCVNPDHLEPVTWQENLDRSPLPSARISTKRACKSGHEFSAENTYVTRSGMRQCRTCHRIRERARKARRAAGVAASWWKHR